MEKIPSMEYTSKESLEFIKKKDKDVKADYFRQIKKDIAHITKNSKKNKVIQFTNIAQYGNGQNFKIWYSSGELE